MVQRIHDNGHVYEGTYEGWYCPRCADFKTESELEEGNRCPIHKIELEMREARTTGSSGCRPSRSRSSGSTPSGPTSSIPQNRYNEALSFIKRACSTCRSAARG